MITGFNLIEFTRVIRDQRVIGEYGIESLKREKDDAREVREVYECGMKLAGFNDLKEGDILIHRATNHAWSNRSDSTCRVLFVLVAAK